MFPKIEGKRIEDRIEMLMHNFDPIRNVIFLSNIFMSGFIHKSFHVVKIIRMVAQNDDHNTPMILHKLLLTIHKHAGIQNICVTKPRNMDYMVKFYYFKMA